MRTAQPSPSRGKAFNETGDNRPSVGLKNLFAIMLLFCASLACAQQAGKVDLIDGDVKIFDAARNVRTPSPGDIVSQGDSIVTGNDGELHVAMADGGQIAVRPNSRMVVEKYRADGGSADHSVLNLLSGAMRSVTGWIGKYSSSNYKIRTPTATIGVRGTDHETLVLATGSPLGEAGTYDKVNSGATVLRTRQGVTELRQNQAGFAAHSGRARPVVLREVPAFFRPTRNEDRFTGLHEKLHQQLEQRRGERIRQLKDRHAGVVRPLARADGMRRYDGSKRAENGAENRHERREGVQTRRERADERSHAEPGHRHDRPGVGEGGGLRQR